MAKDGNATGVYHGNRRYTGQCQFDQSVVGMIGVPGTGQIHYVDENKTTATTGDGSSWAAAFLTVTEGFAALEDYDVLIIAPGNYDETEKLTLSSLKGIKIFGYGTGFQWNEGGTCIRDVSHTAADDLLDIVSCNALEIAGISFVSTGAKDAINFVTGASYSVHIHDCCFVGDVGSGAVQDYGINLSASSGPDLYVHHCKFFHNDIAGIKLSTNQRFTCHDCLFIIPDAGIGIEVENVMATAYHSIWDCKFLGTAGDGADMGIDIADASQQGKIGVWNCSFASCTMTGGGTTGQEASVENYESNATGGAIINPS